MSQSWIERPLPRHLRAWTVEEVRLMRELIATGASLATIAARLRRTVDAVRIRAERHGITLRGVPSGE